MIAEAADVLKKRTGGSSRYSSDSDSFGENE